MKSRLTTWLISAFLLLTAGLASPIGHSANLKLESAIVWVDKAHQDERHVRQSDAAKYAALRAFATSAYISPAISGTRSHSLFQRPPPAKPLS